MTVDRLRPALSGIRGVSGWKARHPDLENRVKPLRLSTESLQRRGHQAPGCFVGLCAQGAPRHRIEVLPTPIVARLVSDYVRCEAKIVTELWCLRRKVRIRQQHREVRPMLPGIEPYRSGARPREIPTRSTHFDLLSGADLDEIGSGVDDDVPGETDSQDGGLV